MPITLPAEVPGSLDYPELPVGAIVAGAAARWGDRVAYLHHDRQLTFAEVYRAACRFANALRAHDIGPGDTVAIHAPNCLAYPVAYYGILLAGATFTPANPLLPPADLAAQLADSGAVAAVSFGRAAQALAAVREHTQVRLVVVTGGEPGPGQLEFEEFSAGQPETRPDVRIDVRTRLAHLAYTGGTTGRSKGVELPHRNVVVNSLQYGCWGSGSVPAPDADGNLTLDQVGGEAEWPARLGTGVGINLTPWFHAMGTIGGLNVPMLSGGTIALQDGFDPVRYLADGERLRITQIGGAPALFAALLACPDFRTRDLSSVRALSSGAAPMPHEMIRALARRFPDAVINEGYGLTEVTMGATSGPGFRSGVRKQGTVGVPVFDTEVKIVPAEGGEDPLPTGEQGEVCIRGPQVMIGYHNRPEETAAVLVDGWLHTGDIGVLDKEGYLSIVDRKKDMLLYKGYNVYPRELEELLMSQPGVRSAAVVGRRRTDVGELPVAFVVRGDDAVTEESLMAAVNENVLPYKRLRELYFVDEIPVSAAGKVLKRELRKQLD
ncbi:AMP-binding protein [Amycolatopsis acidiphila]|uniref:Long-chain fatty acid--CoA ligase n=1 Tax=Amycolatopsis acidiphila TaxID=715473 RepID=A0A558A0G4_9PSEU|nr:AMP-binding protein [Amycolatopsis acidiphila]TVT17755.1 long-chain fatty acid--CoA ligase [Amycolatopsis acidiphila]UIJ60913.1 AMP-binding protein [Amycolatopsis acidiphila]GHG95166.1 long-chain acyl-CoA synthetase [Amycolatopsis acidiphila]